MPALEVPGAPLQPTETLTSLPFKPVTKSHILHCSYDYWHSRYRSSALKSKIIPLSNAFLSYLREDGIVLPPSTNIFPPPETYNDTSTSTGWDDDPYDDPSLAFSEIHQAIQDAIKDLGGLVAPKLNWSAPKDATWIAMKKNSMECSSANDLYLLLKSSDFVTHDLEHAFDDTGPNTDQEITKEDIKYVLVLRKWFKVNPSCEFRCFVRERRVVGICQRDLNHFEFLFPLVEKIRYTITDYFESTLKDTFPEPDFVFDIYLPNPYEKVRLMDINPWAPRTDPLLFSWLELLTIQLPTVLLGLPDSNPVELPPTSSDEDISDDREQADEEIWRPEVRLVKKDDPEAYSFNTPMYSAHKLPRDVVDAGMEGETGMRDFAERWKEMVARGDGVMQQDSESDSDN
ncbi:D123-domain-containing protein [Calycina marina]|uniref:D123-domain-containing protein n=1 Tax=Calycina marina TaxID=1763456 RepID=A0A9P8CF73_9HELO|nr:D123-domain-containing protein [Calycina marina]